MPGMSMRIGWPFMSIIPAPPSVGTSGIGFCRSRSQRSIVAISSCCALMIRLASRCTSGLAPCVGAMRDIAMAWAWWPIMLYMNSTSASTYGFRRLSALALATYADSVAGGVPAVLVVAAELALAALADEALTAGVGCTAGCGAVRPVAGVDGPLHELRAVTNVAAATVR